MLRFNYNPIAYGALEDSIVSDASAASNVILTSSSSMSVTSEVTSIGSLVYLTDYSHMIIDSFMDTLHTRARTHNVHMATISELVVYAIRTLTDAFKASSRYILPYIEIDLGATTVELYSDDIIDFSLVEETSYDLFGGASANEFSMNIRNSNGVFRPTNPASPYYGELKPGAEVRPYLLVELEEDSFVSMALGTFYTGEWSAPSNTLVASVTCYDKLYDDVAVDTPLLMNTTYKEMYELIGIDSVDNNLNDPVPIGWFLEQGRLNNLEWLNEASGAVTYVDRSNTSVAKKLIAEAPRQHLTDTMNIIDMDIPSSYFEAIDGMTVNVYQVLPQTEPETLKLDGQHFENLDIKGPTFNISQIISDANVTSLDYDAYRADISLSASAEAEVLYHPLVPTPTSKETRGTGVGKKLEHPLIQDVTHAADYATRYYDFASNKDNQVNISLRAFPKIRISDTVSFENPTDNYREDAFIVTKSILDFRGGLSHRLEGIRTEVV